MYKQYFAFWAQRGENARFLRPGPLFAALDSAAQNGIP